MNNQELITPDENVQEVISEPLVQSEEQITTRQAFPYKSWLWYVGGYLVHVIVFIPIVILTALIPEINTNSTFYLHAFERSNFFTMYFSFGKLLLWMIMWISGFSYVTMVTLKFEGRSHPFRSRDGSHFDILLLLVVAPLLFFASPIISLRDNNDMQRGWLVELTTNEIVHTMNGSIDEFNTNFNQEVVQNTTFIDSILYFPTHFAEAIYQRERCHSYSLWQVFWYNYLCVLIFFFGLNFTHMSKTPLRRITLKPEAIKKFTKGIWIAFGLIIAFILANIGYSLYLYAKSGVILMYLSVLAVLFGSVIIISFILRKTHFFHFHHYVWGCWVVILWGYQNIYISMVCFLGAGIMIEGVAKWGCDRWWYLKPSLSH